MEQHGRARLGGLLALVVLALLALGTGTASAANFTDYTNVVFSDGFESGTLGAWDGGARAGTGTVAVTAAGAHSGGFGARFTNTAGQASVLIETLPAAAQDSQVSFWVRVAAGGGMQTLAAARDGTSSQNMWGLLYDGAHQGLYFYPYRAAGSTEIYTGNNSVPAGAWTQVQIDYTATATGGAQLYLNGQTQPDWGVTGDYTRTANLQRLQLWDDTTATTDFDDVSIATPPLTPPPPATVPGAPTAVQGAPGDRQAALSWTAPSSDGGSPITGYRITPYVNGTAQTATTTSTTSTSATVTGLTNGTTYTFTVAAINSVGTGADSLGSAQITPSQAAATAPGAPTGVSAGAGDTTATVNWTAPASDGGSAITGYRITPFVGTVAQTPTTTPTAATSGTVTGLTDGTSYTFTVAAINGVGTGPDSTPSAAVTPTSNVSPYTNVVFSDGFESGNLAAWDLPTGGAGSVAASAAAAHAGSFGVRFANTSGQSGILQKKLASAVADSSTSFWLRVAPGGGVETIAQAKDGNSSATMWGLLYDGTHNGLYFYPHTATSSTEIYTGNGSVPANTWTQVEIRYTGTTTGGAKLLINGQTQAGWQVTGDYSHTGGDLQRIQLWDDTVATTDIDDVTVATQPAAPPTVADPPTGVQGTAGDSQVALSWTAPANNGNSAITGYRITPYVGSTAQTPVTTTTPATSRTVTGLTNGTAYTFKVATINGVGTGSDSAASPAVTPNLAAASVPGAPTGVTGTPGDTTIDLSWSAPSSDGGSPITGYRITPFIGATAQTPITTSTTATQRTITGLADGTSYSFTVAAINAVGTGADSSPSPGITPTANTSKYTNVVFADGFESGGLSNWDSSSGTVAASAAAAHAGSFGVRFTNAAGQSGVLQEQLANPAKDSSVSFWVRIGPGGGVQTLAQTRDASNGQTMWALLYDGNRHGLYFYPFRSSGSTEIYTGDNSVPANTWTQIEVQYTATASGGAQVLINGQTNPLWSVSGDYTRTADLQRLQLWDDTVATTDFDDVRVATPAASVPGAPTGVQATAGNKSASVSWTAPSDNGGASITAYRITPYVGTTAQTATTTSDAGTSATVNGLTNGTAYTFKVAAINVAGTGADSAASNSVTPVAPPPGVPGAPTGVQGNAGDRSVDLNWTAPPSDGGSAITGYRITPYVNGTAQAATTTTSNATSRTVTGLSNGTAYTFTVAAINAVGAGPDSGASAAVTPQSGTVNPIQLENQQTGDPNWNNFTEANLNGLQLAGYGSKISVNHGGSLDLYVTTTAATVSIDVYRMGWYDGAGARLMQSLGSFPGVSQPQAAPDRTTGVVAENWTKTTTLNVPSSWTTGMYLARLMLPGGVGSVIPFVVRDDGGHEALLLQASTNTWQAYNTYGGTSAYNNNVGTSVYPWAHAMKVSYDRPFITGDGAGDFLRFEYPMVRWLEKSGYNAAYTTDVDVGAGTNPLTNYKGLLTVGHDEYWNKGQRDNVEAAIAAGVDVGFFGGNTSYWQVRTEANAAGTPNRVLVTYKADSEATGTGGPDPQFGVNNSLVTTNWRDPLVNRPEDAMMGEMWGGQVGGATGWDYVVQNASNWVYNGTGFANGTHVPNLINYEYDKVHTDTTQPANVTVLSTSPLTTNFNTSDTANSTIYKAPSGAWVVDAGDIVWSQGLDNYGGTTTVSAGIQKMTANILDAFTGAITPP